MKKGLSANILKILAIVIMVVDHIAGYLYQEFNQDILKVWVKLF